MVKFGTLQVHHNLAAPHRTGGELPLKVSCNTKGHRRSFEVKGRAAWMTTNSCISGSGSSQASRPRLPLSSSTTVRAEL